MVLPGGICLRRAKQRAEFALFLYVCAHSRFVTGNQARSVGVTIYDRDGRHMATSVAAQVS